MNLFSDLVSNIVLNYICNRVSTVFSLDKNLIKEAILNENFSLVNNDHIIDVKEEEEEKKCEEKYSFNFSNLTYRGEENFWKHIGIRIEGVKYRLHLATNLVLNPINETLYLIGMKNNDNELILKDELRPEVFKWCEVHSIKY
jgi:hypothetical protein